MEFMRDPRISVPIIAGGLAFMVVKIATGAMEFFGMSLLYGLIAAVVAAGIGYGVVHFMGSRD